ncbi:MAG: M6 family metalloprotease-like protein [Planctomycetota bacterium]|jgi:M6 family metalloprotease-like protein
MYCTPLLLSLPLVLLSLQAPPAQELLGLNSSEPIFLGEGPTDTALHPPSTGTLKAVMLFARFPDGEEDLSMKELHRLLVPQAAQFFESSSYGKLKLEVTPHFEWYAMKGASTDPGYDCSKHETHKGYVQEVVAAADEDIDFSDYALIYVVANKAPGTFNSPTFNAHGGEGFRADGHEIRSAVTFGNDVRGENWGWQTLVHETGHVLGLPDLYSYEPSKGVYKNIHRFTGSWDPMGFQCHSRHYLAWHKRKLGWLDDEHFEVITEGKGTAELSHIESGRGLKALVLPISKSEAYVAEVRHLSEERREAGVLFYKVSVATPSGRGAIQVLPAKPDDDEAQPGLAKRYIALYDALFAAGSTFEDEETGVRVEVKAGAKGGFRLDVTRAE